MLTPNVRGNAGCYRAFTVKAPEGSVLNCDKPMAVNLRTRTGWYIAPNIFTRARQGGARPRAGGDRPAGRDQHLRPRRRGADLFGPSVHGRRAGRLGSRRRRVGAAVADLGGQHLDRAARAARAGAGHREGLCAGLRRPRPPSRRARPARQRAQARRRRPADARLGLSGRRRHRGAGPVRRQAGPLGARRRARCVRRDHPRIAAPGSSSPPRPIRRSSRCASRAAPASARRSSARSRRSRAISPKATSRRRPPCATTAW